MRKQPVVYPISRRRIFCVLP